MSANEVANANKISQFIQSCQDDDSFRQVIQIQIPLISCLGEKNNWAVISILKSTSKHELYIIMNHTGNIYTLPLYTFNFQQILAYLHKTPELLVPEILVPKLIVPHYRFEMIWSYKDKKIQFPKPNSSN